MFIRAFSVSNQEVACNKDAFSMFFFPRDCVGSSGDESEANVQIYSIEISMENLSFLGFTFGRCPCRKGVDAKCALLNLWLWTYLHLIALMNFPLAKHYLLRLDGKLLCYFIFLLENYFLNKIAIFMMFFNTMDAVFSLLYAMEFGIF